jgi:hypothetical protein
MRTSLRTIVLLLGLFGCSYLADQSTIIEDREALVWDEMCEMIQEINDVGLGEPDYNPFYTCGDVEKPLVVYKWMRKGLYGYYEGGDTVVVSNAIPTGQVYGTLFHEYIHYLHVQLGMIEVPGYAEEICWSEDQAFRLEGIWSGDDNSTWWKVYPHCWPYYGTQEAKNAYNLIQWIYIWTGIDLEQ